MEEFQDRLDRCPSCGYQETGDWKEEGILRPGRILQGRYILGTVRREGDTDITYIGWDALFSRKVLIQEFFPKLIARRTPDLAAVPLLGQEAVFNEGVNRFYQSRRKMILLYKEPDIECFYSVFRDNGTAFATMQYCDAQRISEYVEEQGPLDADEALKFLYMAGNAVKKVHRNGLLHGNVSMDSFFVMPMTKSLVLTGFAEPCHYCGDPEALDYRAEGTYTDVFGLAMMFCEMIAGTPGLTPEAAEAVLQRTKAKLSDRSRAAIEAALGLGDDERTSSVDQFLKGVFSDGKTIELTKEISENMPRAAKGARRTKGDDRRRLILLGAAGGAALAALIIAGFLLFRTFPKKPAEERGISTASNAEQSTEPGEESTEAPAEGKESPEAENSKADTGKAGTEDKSKTETSASEPESSGESAAAGTSEAAVLLKNVAAAADTGSGTLKATEPESKAPEATKAPKATKAPEATKEPTATKASEATKAPKATKAPETTEAPDTTKVPETTEASETTKAVETTEAAEESPSSRAAGPAAATVEPPPEMESASGPGSSGHVSPTGGRTGTVGPGVTAAPSEDADEDGPQSI